MANRHLQDVDIDSLSDPGTHPSIGSTMAAPPATPLQGGGDAEIWFTDDEIQQFRDSGMGEDINSENSRMKRRIRLHKRWTTCADQEVYDLQNVDPVHILLLGTGGVGKSSVGNLLVGREVFIASSKATSETKSVHPARTTYNGKTIIVYDTPGYLMRELLENESDPERLIKEGVKTIDRGIHVFIFVMNATSSRDRSAEIKLITKANLLNRRTFTYCMVVATHAMSHYATKGADTFITDGRASTGFDRLMTEIDQRVVLVELGDGPITEDKLLAGTAVYDRERQAAREQVMNMVGRVMHGKPAEDVMYTKENIIRDLQECFPSTAKVHTPNGEKTMADLKLNDYVLVMNNQGSVFFEKVIMFSHASEKQTSLFLSITTTDGNVLLLTPGHLLHVGGIGQLKAAKCVQVGDEVFTLTEEGGFKLKSTLVKIIKYEELSGIYCPHTASGNIISNGIAASCYTEYLPATLAHAFMFPVRLLHQILPTDWFTWILPYNSEQGMPQLLWKLANTAPLTTLKTKVLG